LDPEKLLKNAQKRNELRDEHNIIGLEIDEPDPSWGIAAWRARYLSTIN
jgi:hypothetical protein